MAANIKSIKVAATSLSGTVSQRAAGENSTTQVTVNFSTPFASVPTVSLALNSCVNYKGGSMTAYVTVSASSITKAGFVLNLKNTNSSASYYADCVVQWTAVEE